MRMCSTCKFSKDDDCFAFKNKAKGTRNSVCKECQNKYAVNNYNQNKEYYLAKAKKNSKIMYDRNREFIDKLKSEKGCLYCEENDPCCLDFHHTSDDKEFSISNKLKTLKTEKLEKEILKCEVVCSNCHRKLHAGKELSIRREI